MLKGFKKYGLYTLFGKTVCESSALISKIVPEKTMLWHRWIGYISKKGLHYLHKQNLLNDDKIDSLDFCDHCVLGKQHKLSFSTSTHKSTSVIDYIHCDLWGPEKVPTYGGNVYFLSVV